MSSILLASGFKNLESLKEFSERFPNVRGPMDKELVKIWICHKTPEEMPKFGETTSLPSEEYCDLARKIKKKIACSKTFLSLMTEFSPLSIFDKIYSHFKKQLATYILTKCYLFYNWGVNAFEPVFDHFEIHKQIENRKKEPVLKEQRDLTKKFRGNSHIRQAKDESKIQIIKKEGSVDLFEEPANSAKFSKSRLSLKAVKEAINKAEKFYDISKSSTDPFQETFNLKNILYNRNQKPDWPNTHILSANSVDDLLTHIIHMPLATNINIQEKLMNDSKNWFILKELLGRFIRGHAIISKRNGYFRILKKHLKKGWSGLKSIEGLVPIPKSVVCSYMLDILRRVLPLELFGNNRLRKNFFRELTKIIKGAKEQNFIWYPLLRSLLMHESELSWCSELGDYYTRSQIILKLFKFLVMQYIFVLLKKNFYITETGRSGFGLRFYRKGDMGNRISVFLSNLLNSKHVRPLKSQDNERESLERIWLETGEIKREDIKRKIKKFMSHDSEYRQPMARTRFFPKSDESDQFRIITTLPRHLPNKPTAGKRNLEKIFKVRLVMRKKKLFLVSLLLEFFVEKYGSGIKPVPTNPVLEMNWKKAVEFMETFGKLYFVKTDIADAFGSVKHNILMELLKKLIEEELHFGKLELKKIIEWKKNIWRIEKNARFSFGTRPKENSVIISRSVYLHHKRKINVHCDWSFLEVIKQMVTMQRIQLRGKIFRLIKGLALGSAGMLSPHLNELYYSSMDRHCFMELVNPRDSILMRAVDDYMFITSNEEKAKKFLELVQKGIDHFDVRFNERKSYSNLMGGSQQVLYLGLVFDFGDMSVKPSYLRYERTGVLPNFQLSDPWGNAHFNKSVFMERKLLQINCLKLYPIVLNSCSLKAIRQSVFEACLVQSVRVICLANHLFSGRIKNDLAVYKILLVSRNKILSRMRKSSLSRDEVTWLFFLAASHVMRKWYGQFKLLSIIIRFRLENCEKAFINAGSELLLDFLRNDVLDQNYWNRVNAFLKELKKKDLN